VLLIYIISEKSLFANKNRIECGKIFVALFFTPILESKNLNDL